MSISDELRELRKRGDSPAKCPYCEQYRIPEHMWKWFPDFKRQAELEELEADPKKHAVAMVDELLTDFDERLKERMAKEDTDNAHS